MTPKQNSLYWREWAAVHRLDPEADRHALHAQALGVDKSHKDFSNADLDKILGVFRAITRPDSLNAQLRQQDQPRTRLLHRIRDQIKCLALFVDFPVPYSQAILRSRFQTDFLEDLSADPRPRITEDNFEIDDSDLEMMRNTLGRALARLRQQSAYTEHEMCRAAGVDCFRTHCAQCRDSGVAVPAAGPEASRLAELAEDPF